MYRPEDLRPGDILLLEGDVDVFDPIGLFILWASDNRFQHVALVGHGELIEAIDQVGVVPLDAYAPVGWRFRVPSATPEQVEDAVRWAEGRIGHPFGQHELTMAHEGLRIPFYRRFDPHDTIAAGFVCWAYEQAGIQLTWQPLPTPASLLYSPLLVGPRPGPGGTPQLVRAGDHARG